MSWIGCNVRSLPVNWEANVTFKEPADNDKLGWIDPINFDGNSKRSATTFRFLAAQDLPLTVKQVRTPYECFSLSDVLGKGRGKLTVRMQINKSIWASLDNLDTLFRGFLIRNRTKLFSKQDAEYIGRDNSAVALKFKALAQRGPDGLPLYDSYITVRISGRSGEIEDMETKDGPTGKFVSAVSWVPRTTPLAATATRLSLVTGVSADGLPIVSDTLPIEGPVPVGAQRMRYVGPGDIASDKNGGCTLRYALIRPAYWSLAPGGSASITLVLDSAILMNGAASPDSGTAGVMPPLEAPDGFALASAAESSSSTSHAISFPGPTPSRSATSGDWGVSNASMFHATSTNKLPANEEKRRRTESVGAAPSAVVEGELERKQRIQKLEQSQYLYRIQEETEKMKRGSAIAGLELEDEEE